MKTTNLPSYNTQSLRRAGRRIAPPFLLAINYRGGIHELVCHDILRNLPGKRLVCFGTWRNQEQVVAKIYLDHRRGKIHFQRELRGIRALETADIPTPPLLYNGSLAEGEAPILLTRRIEKSRDLKNAFMANPSADDMEKMLKAAVASIAKMHSAGLSQRDIHPGNFLLVQNTVMVIDGADIRQHRQKPLPQHPSIANLGFFLSPFHSRYEDLITGWIATYCRFRGWSLTPGLMKQAEKAISRWNNRREKKFLQKTLRSSSAFFVRKTWHRRMVCNRIWYSPTVKPLLDDPDTAMKAGTVLKAGNSATVVKIKVNDSFLVVKRYNLKNRCHALSRALRPTRAVISWRNANRLRHVGIPTPQPVAFIEERWGPIRRRSYFISAYTPGKSLSDVVEINKAFPKKLKHYANCLFCLMKNFYRHRISHGDLKSSNLLLGDNQLIVIDLDGMRKHHFFYRYQKAFRKDVHRLFLNWQHNASFLEILSERIIEFFPNNYKFPI